MSAQVFERAAQRLRMLAKHKPPHPALVPLGRKPPSALQPRQEPSLGWRNDSKPLSLDPLFRPAMADRMPGWPSAEDVSGSLSMANWHSSGDWQFKQPVAMALPTVILKAGWLRCWAARFLPGGCRPVALDAREPRCRIAECNTPKHEFRELLRISLAP